MKARTTMTMALCALLLCACGGGNSVDGTDTATDNEQDTTVQDVPVDTLSDLIDTLEDTPEDTATDEDGPTDPVLDEADGSADPVVDEEDSLSDPGTDVEDGVGDVEVEDGIEECIAEGDSGPVIIDAPECCAGLTTIPCSEVGAGGTCATLMGVFCCSYCGNGTCGLGENVCNCPTDCHS